MDDPCDAVFATTVSWLVLVTVASVASATTRAGTGHAHSVALAWFAQTGACVWLLLANFPRTSGALTEWFYTADVPFTASVCAVMSVCFVATTAAMSNDAASGRRVARRRAVVATVIVVLQLPWVAVGLWAATTAVESPEWFADAGDHTGDLLNGTLPLHARAEAMPPIVGGIAGACMVVVFVTLLVYMRKPYGWYAVGGTLSVIVPALGALVCGAALASMAVVPALRELDVAWAASCGALLLGLAMMQWHVALVPVLQRYPPRCWCCERAVCIDMCRRGRTRYYQIVPHAGGRKAATSSTAHRRRADSVAGWGAAVELDEFMQDRSEPLIGAGAVETARAVVWSWLRAVYSPSMESDVAYALSLSPPDKPGDVWAWLSAEGLFNVAIMQYAIVQWGKMTRYEARSAMAIVIMDVFLNITTSTDTNSDGRTGYVASVRLVDGMQCLAGHFSTDSNVSTRAAVMARAQLATSSVGVADGEFFAGIVECIADIVNEAWGRRGASTV